MKVLFVCQGNMGRSQVAQVYFAQLSQHESDSAGMGVDASIARRHQTGRKLKDAPTQRSIEYIKREFGVDISDRDRKQLTPEMMEEADRVIVINEKERWPDYVVEGGNVVHWDIADVVGHEDDFAYDIYRRVRKRVEELVREIG